MKRPCRSLFALTFLCLPVLPLLAQDAQPSSAPPIVVIRKTKPQPKTTTPKKSPAKSKSSNVKVGIIVAIDAENSTLSLNEKSGVHAYTLTDKTRYHKEKAEVELTAFKVGEQATLKLRKVRGKDEYVVQEIADSISWDQLDAIRHKQMQATIQKIEDGELSVTFGSETTPFVYTTSEKTAWSKAGKDALPATFKAGEIVTIVPRALPSGSVMAAIVADSAQAATHTKIQHSRSVTGQIAVLDSSKGHIVVTLSPQDTREFAYSPATLVMFGSRPATAAALKLGQRIRASLKQLDAEMPEASRITIETRKAIKKTPVKPRIGTAVSVKTLQGLVPNKK